MNKEGLVKKQGLTQADTDEIRQLVEICNRYENLNVKINWSWMSNRPTTETNDFCYYRNNNLVAYMPIDGFGKEVEITAVVLPEVRRTKSATTLLNAALSECRQREIEKALLVSERASVAGTAFAKAVGATYASSEYHMIWQPIELSTPKDIQLQAATSDDREILAQVHTSGFGDALEEARVFVDYDFAEAGNQIWLARLNDTPIGKISASPEDTGMYIRAFVVLPEYRGRGYGRQILSATIQTLLSQGFRDMSLDVATDNENALGLYKACGFREANVYDYYDLLEPVA